MGVVGREALWELELRWFVSSCTGPLSLSSSGWLHVRVFPLHFHPCMYLWCGFRLGSASGKSFCIDMASEAGFGLVPGNTSVPHGQLTCNYLMIRWDDSDLCLLGCLVIDGMSKLHYLPVWDLCL